MYHSTPTYSSANVSYSSTNYSAKFSCCGRWQAGIQCGSCPRRGN